MQGYILEEILAYLIRNSGYRLLVDRSQDPRELDNRGNGLVVNGRGAVHQVDVLGQLEWVPAFTFPLRLFVEAKFRSDKMGIGFVRNAVGLLLDINENYSQIRERKLLLQKYQYVYALFSTSGFTKPAQDMALAHQISIIDLSGEDYRKLTTSIAHAATLILSDETDLPANVVLKVRYALRSALHTQPAGVQFGNEINTSVLQQLSGAIQSAKEYGELFIAMANGPYMLLLYSQNPESFLTYCTEHPTHKVAIHWPRAQAPWEISPAHDSEAYKLSFNLPPRLSDWVFETNREATKEAKARALDLKQEFFSNITVYHRGADRDQLFRLEFDPDSVVKATTVNQ